MRNAILAAAMMATMSATMSNCATLCAQQHALAPIETVDYDLEGLFHVNGKPFFPILLYDAPTDDKTLAELRDFGFNTLTCKSDDAAALRAKGFYAAVHHAKPGVDAANILVTLGIDSPALNYKTGMLQKTVAANNKSREAVPKRPVMNAIGYWEDEPAGVVAGKLPSKPMYEHVISAIDVAAPYLYPVPYQPVASVGEAIARAREVPGGGKPIVPILQLFSWDAKARYPTPAELRCMAFLALAEGATGIGYYSYGYVTGHPKKTIAEVEPELWKSVKQLNKELAEFAPVYARGGKPVKVLSEAKNVRSYAPVDKEFPFAIVNPSDKATTVSFAMKAGSVVLGDGRTIKFVDGRNSLEMKPFEVVIVRRFGRS